MAAEAHRLQEHAAFESTVAMAAGRQQLHERHVLPDPDPDSESDGDKTQKGDKHADEIEELIDIADSDR